MQIEGGYLRAVGQYLRFGAELSYRFYGIGAYRDLLEQWKGAGRAGKKADDALWARFKAAGGALYGARGEREAAARPAVYHRRWWLVYQRVLRRPPIVAPGARGPQPGPARRDPGRGGRPPAGVAA